MNFELPIAPGDYLKNDMAKRGWNQKTLSEILGLTPVVISQILSSKKAVNLDIAIALGTAFGNGAQFWMGMETEYRLALMRRREDPDIRKRAQLFEIAPVKELEKRGWIQPTKSLAELELELCQLYDVSSMEHDIVFEAVARRTNATDTFSGSHIAWYKRARQLAKLIKAEKFSQKKLEKGLSELKSLSGHPEQLRHVSKLLASLGVRLVIIEPLSNTKIDGAAFWVEDCPVIAMSVRYDRIDSFWFTLAHELSHIVYHDEAPMDSDMFSEGSLGSEIEEMEARANNDASEFLISFPTLQSFILRVKPFYSKTRIIQFANRLKVHPGIVVGQLQHRSELGWQTNREMLSKVRSIVTATALTDGWGQTIKTL